MIGTSSVTKTRSIRQVLGQIEQRLLDSGKQRGGIRWSSAACEELGWGRPWCFTKEERRMARSPTGLCMSIVSTNMIALVLLLCTRLVSQLEEKTDGWFVGFSRRKTTTGHSGVHRAHHPPSLWTQGGWSAALLIITTKGTLWIRYFCTWESRAKRKIFIIRIRVLLSITRIPQVIFNSLVLPIQQW